MPQEVQLSQSSNEARRAQLKMHAFEQLTKETLSTIRERCPATENQIKEELLLDLGLMETSIPYLLDDKKRYVRASTVASNFYEWLSKVDHGLFIEHVEPVFNIPAIFLEAIMELQQRSIRLGLGRINSEE